MLKFAVLGIFVWAVQSSARPQAVSTTTETQIPIVSQSESNDGSGVFNYAFETGNGIKEEASGQLKTIGSNGTGKKFNEIREVILKSAFHLAVVQQGKYSYTAPDGQVIEITWVADENGFQPQGAAIPTLGGVGLNVPTTTSTIRPASG